MKHSYRHTQCVSTRRRDKMSFILGAFGVNVLYNVQCIYNIELEPVCDLLCCQWIYVATRPRMMKKLSGERETLAH